MGRTNLFISNSEIQDAGRLWRKIFLLTPVLLLVWAVNVYIDPAGLYKKNTDKYQRNEYHMAQALAAGRDVRITQPIDERLLQKYFVESLTITPDIVVLGSSHSVWIGDNIFPNKNVINNSVSVPVLADYLGIFEGYARKNVYPPRVICVLDPQLIVSPVISERWVSIKEDTYGMLGRLGVPSKEIKEPVIPQAWLNIFSFSYFQRSMEQLLSRHYEQINPVNEDGASEPVLLKDGRRLREKKFLVRDTVMSRRVTIRELYHGGYVQSLRNHPDQGLENILERFLGYLTAHHIRVTLCLLPIHPELYKINLVPQKTPGALDIVGIEQYYRRLAQQLNLEIVGSYDPAACDLEAQDFYDQEHIRNEKIEKMLKQKGSPCSMPGL